LAFFTIAVVSTTPLQEDIITLTSGVISHQHRGKTYAHALTSAFPVFQLVVVNQQQPQMREKRTANTKQVCRRDPFGLQLYM